MSKKKHDNTVSIIFILLIIIFAGVTLRDPTISNLNELKIVIQQQ